MDSRTLSVGLGIALANFVVVAAVLTQALEFEFSGIFGLFVGLLAAGGAFSVVLVAWVELDVTWRAIGVGVAGFGYAVFIGFGLRYIGALGLRSILDLQLVVLGALVVGGLAAGFYWGQYSEES